MKKETSTASKPTATKTLEKAEDRGVELELMQVRLKLQLAENTQAFLFTKGSQVNSQNLPTEEIAFKSPAFNAAPTHYYATVRGTSTALNGFPLSTFLI